MEIDKRIEKPEADKIIAAVPTEEPEVIKDPSKYKAPEVSKEKIPTTREENPQSEKKAPINEIEKYMPQWGRIVLSPDACDNCVDDYNSVEAEAEEAYEKYHNEDEKNQNATHCQLKTVLKIMIENIKKNTHNKNRAKSYNSGFGHKTFSYAEGTHPTCKCKWIAKDGKTFTMIDLNNYIKETLGFKDILD
jgi:hypothetical protein